MGAYHDEYSRWRADPEAFWAEQARVLDWHRPFERVLDRTAARRWDRSRASGSA